MCVSTYIQSRFHIYKFGWRCTHISQIQQIFTPMMSTFSICTRKVRYHYVPTLVTVPCACVGRHTGSERSLQTISCYTLFNHLLCVDDGGCMKDIVFTICSCNVRCTSTPWVVHSMVYVNLQTFPTCTYFMNTCSSVRP